MPTSSPAPALSPPISADPTTLSFAFTRLSHLPSKWLSDYDELSAEKAAARAEEEALAAAAASSAAAAAAKKQKGSKGAAANGGAPPTPSSSNVKKGDTSARGDATVPPTPSSSSKKDAATSAAVPAATPSAKPRSATGDKPASKRTLAERQKEIEAKALAERLNSMWRFGVEVDVGSVTAVGTENKIRQVCKNELEMPPEEVDVAVNAVPAPEAAQASDATTTTTTATAAIPQLNLATETAAAATSTTAQTPKTSPSGTSTPAPPALPAGATSPSVPTTGRKSISGGQGTVLATKQSGSSKGNESARSTSSQSGSTTTAAAPSSNIVAPPTPSSKPSASTTSSKKGRQTEEERLLRAAAEAKAEQAQAKLDARMAARFFRFDVVKQEVTLSQEGVEKIKDMMKKGEGFQVTVWRELVCTMPQVEKQSGSGETENDSNTTQQTEASTSSTSTNTQTETILQRDTILIGVGSLTLASFQKQGRVSACIEVGEFKLKTGSSNNISSSTSTEVQSNVQDSETARAVSREAGDTSDASSAVPPPSTGDKEKHDKEKEKDKESTTTTTAKPSAPAHKPATTTKAPRTIRGGKAAVAVEIPVAATIEVIDPFAQMKLTIDLVFSAPLHPLPVRSVLSLQQFLPKRVIEQKRQLTDEEEFAKVVREFLEELKGVVEKNKYEAASNNNGQQLDDHSLTPHILNTLNTMGIYTSLKTRLQPILQRFHLTSRSLEQHTSLNANGVGEGAKIQFDTRVSRLYQQAMEKLNLVLGEIFAPTMKATGEGKAVSYTTPVESVRSVPEVDVIPDREYEDIMSSLSSSGSTPISIHPFSQVTQQILLSREGPFVARRLRIQAQEAELEGDIPRAARLWHARCELEWKEYEKDGSDDDTDESQSEESLFSTYWYDYSLFQLRIGNMTAGKECMKYALTINPEAQKIILALAAVCLENAVKWEEEEEKQKAEEEEEHAYILLRAYSSLLTTNGGKESTEACLLQAFYADRQAEFKQEEGAKESAERWWMKAEKLYKSSIAATSTSQSSAASVHTHLTSYLLSLNCLTLAEKTLSRDQSQAQKHVLKAKIVEKRIEGLRLINAGGTSQDEKINSLFTEAHTHLTQASELSLTGGNILSALALRGHLYWSRGERDSAIQEYESWLSWEPAGAQLDSRVLIRLGTYYLHTTHKYDDAKLCFNLLCTVAPSSSAWLGVALSYSALDGDSSHIDAALREGNWYDKSNSTIYAHQVIHSLHADRMSLAHQSLLTTLKLQCSDHTLLHKIGRLYRSRGHLQVAESLHHRTLALRESVRVRLDLADIAHARGMYEEEREHLVRAKEIVENDEEEVQWKDEVMQKCMQLHRLLSAGKNVPSATLPQPRNMSATAPSQPIDTDKQRARYEHEQKQQEYQPQQQLSHFATVF